jgi:hypothetical protein
MQSRLQDDYSQSGLPLKVGTPVHVVAERLGHQNVTVTLEIAHALPSMQQEAADQISSLIGG